MDMVAFKVAFLSVFVALMYMFPGYLLGKAKKAVAGHLSTMPYSFKASLFILGSVPCASVILNMAEIHGKEQKLSANCILLSTLLCIFTIPVMSLLLTFL